jgi:hypothetical protein
MFTRVVVPIAPIALVFSIACSESKVVQTTSEDGGVETADGARRESQPCKSGDTTRPIEAFDISGEDHAKGTACNVANVLDEDANFAGLDWSGTGTRTLGDHEVSGCVAIEFSDGVTLSSLSMKLRPVATGCDHPCAQGECGKGRKVSLFAGPSIEKLEFMQVLPLVGADFKEYRVSIYERIQAKFVAICREPIPGDDIAIESVYGFCN